MALKADDIKVGEKVYIGLFEGTVVRIIKWQGVTMVDVEISGVIDRYHIDHIEKIHE